jgi:pimeloyl-ACP methyl ester carboxylesterase
MAQWARNFTVIAPDTPGYGLSDPLPDSGVRMEDLADAVMAFADAIGLSRFALYGYHTGGGMAVALAHAYPARITAAAANGLVMPTPDELAAILANYLPPFEPRWDGSHLAWLWARLREQTIFFPWHDRRLSARMDFAVPGASGLQRNVREFLLAADHYHVAYRAAFEYAAGPVLPQLEVPTLVTAAAADPLAPHLERIGDRADCVKIEVAEDGAAAIDTAFAHLLAYPGDPAPASPATCAIAQRAWQDMVNVGDSSVRLVRNGEAVEVLALHDAGGSAWTVPAAVSGMGNVAAMDLPGHGERVPLLAEEDQVLTIAVAADDVIAVARALEVQPVLAGDGAGALVALEAAARAPEQFKALVLTNLPVLDVELAAAWQRDGLPGMEPEWHGGHLLRAWHMVRDGQLFFPWFRRSPAGIRWVEPELEPRQLQLQVRELLVADGNWQALRREQLGAEPAALLAAASLPLVLASATNNPRHEATLATASHARRGVALSIEGPAEVQAAALRRAVASLPAC